MLTIANMNQDIGATLKSEGAMAPLGPIVAMPVPLWEVITQSCFEYVHINCQIISKYSHYTHTLSHVYTHVHSYSGNSY